MANDNSSVNNHSVESPAYPCLCAVIRRAGRILTTRYDKYLETSGLKITQFSMLANIARNLPITVSGLAKLLVMDQTTVSRNLKVLEKSGYIHLEPAETDQRIRTIQITEMGMSKMNEARLLWKKAQLDMEQTLGHASIESLLGTFKKIAG